MPLGLEEWMLESLCSSQSLRGVQFEKPFNERHTFLTYFSKIFLLQFIKIMNFRELHAKIALILEKTFLKIRWQSSKGFLDEKQLIEFILPWKQRISIQQFAHYASNSPQINFLTICSSNKQLGWSIPSGGYIISKNFLFLFQLPCKPEIAYFQSIFLTDQQILGFDVPMYDVELMQVDKSLEQLIDEGANGGEPQPVRCLLQNFQHIILNVFEYKIDDSFFAEGLFELDNIGMGGQFEDLHFTHSCLFCMFFFVCLFEFLNCNMNFGLNITAFEDYPIGTFPNG